MGQGRRTKDSCYTQCPTNHCKITFTTTQNLLECYKLKAYFLRLLFCVSSSIKRVFVLLPLALSSPMYKGKGHASSSSHSDGPTAAKVKHKLEVALTTKYDTNLYELRMLREGINPITVAINQPGFKKQASEITKIYNKYINSYQNDVKIADSLGKLANEAKQKDFKLAKSARLD